MDNGIIEKSMKRYKAISYLKQRLDFFRESTTTAHLRLVLTGETEIRQLMPGVKSQFQKERMHLIELIEYARQVINGDKKRIPG